MTDDSLFDGDQTESPQGPQKKRWRDRWLLLSITGVVVLALMTGGVILGIFGKSTAEALDSIQRDPTIMPTNSDRPEPVPSTGSTGPLDLVLMVTQGDTRDDRGIADVAKLMLLHAPADRQNAYLISIPSDYWVDIPGNGTNKIVEAYPAGGPALTVETVEKLLDVRVDHTAVIELEGMVNVIDTLGGVTVTNKYATASNGFTYPKGPVELTGLSAANFVQEREGLPDSKLHRIERQQDVLTAVADKLISREVLTNPTMFGDAIKILGPNFTVDSGLTNDTIIRHGTSMRLGGGDDVVNVLAPGTRTGAIADDQSHEVVDEAKLAELRDALRNDTMNEYVKANS